MPARGLLDPTLPGMDDVREAWGVLKGLLSPPDPYADAGKAVQEYRAGRPMDAFATMAGSMPATGTLKANPGVIAYHGSPHSFDRFDMSKIGTGEGAQAYGHGLYFAEAEPVAEDYRKSLAGLDTFHVLDGKGNPVDEFASEEFAKSLADQIGGTYQKQSGSPGHMYQVRINADPEHFLDWDKPLSEQSPVVQEALGQFPLTSELKDGMSLMPGAKLRIENDPDFGPKYFMELDSGMKVRLLPKDIPNMVATKPEEVWGRNIVSTVASTAGSEAKASEALRQAGIPGIKYLDQGSRGAGEGSRNYVVFDDKLVEILKKYGIVGLLGAPAAYGASQGSAQQPGL